MKLSERLGMGAPDYLFERKTDTKYDDDLYRWTVVVPLAMKAWFRETFDRKRSLGGVYTSFKDTKESRLHHVLEGIEFVGMMEIADRAANGLRVALTRDYRDEGKPSVFGQIFKKAYENPALSDHNHEHIRRQERWFETMLLNIGELRHSHSIFDWIDSGLLFSFHDADQLMTLERNLDEGTRLDAKKGHGLAAAVMLFALHKRYAIERKTSIHNAWEICSGTALMAMKHDRPEEFVQAMSGMKPAFTINADGTRALLTGDTLEHAFEKNELDLFSLSPSQLLALLRRVKSKYGFIREGDMVSYGLHPEFEKEYAGELAELSGNHDPLIKDITPEGRRSFRLAAEAAVQADVLEMVSPPVESIFRTLNTQLAKSRPFFRSDDIELTMQRITDSQGNIPTEIDSNVRRMYWELMHIEHMPESIITKSNYMKRINEDHAIMGAILFQDIGTRIMRGDYSDLDRVYMARKIQLAEKALVKADMGLAQKMFLLKRMREGDTGAVQTQLRKKEYAQLAERLAEKLGHLDTEMASILDGLTHKPGGYQGGKTAFSDEDIEKFSTVSQRVIEALCEKYHVSPRALKRYKSKVASSKFSSMIPYSTYDSMGTRGRTLVAPYREI
ncbi:MAG: hypothetical protein AAB481_02165 [Patescibacteria group bacterium]